MPMSQLTLTKAALLALAGGYAAAALGIPLPWFTGPMAVIAVGRLRGGALHCPTAVRQSGQLVVGLALGLYFTPAVAAELAAHGLFIALAAVLTVLMTYPMGAMLRRHAGADPVTAFFSSLPGGASEMVVLGEAQGAVARQVATAHVLRVMVVVLTIPAVLQLWLGVSRGSLPAAPDTPFVVIPHLELLGLGLAAAWVATRVGLTNPFLLGPLFAAAALAVSGASWPAVPGLVVKAAQLFLGWNLGSRLDRAFIAEAPRFVTAVLLGTAFSLVACALLAVLIAQPFGLAGPAAILAAAPGGIAEMCITARVLHLGVPLVTACHLARVLVVLLGARPLLAAYRRWVA